MTIRSQKYRNTYAFPINVKYFDIEGRYVEEVLFANEEMVVASKYKPRFFRTDEAVSYTHLTLPTKRIV